MKVHPTMTRRSLLGVAAIPAAGAARATDRIGMGLIGAGHRGTYLAQEANKCGGIQWVGVADAWDERRNASRRVTGQDVALYGDYRKLLDRKDVDAVIVATWDNTHARITADACRAGKDVYVEKPLTSRPEQGPPLVRAVRESGRLVQVGVQQRSTPHFIEAKQRFIDSGRIGQVHMVRTMWNNNVYYLLKPPAGMETKPAGLDWRACLGDLGERPWDPKMFFNRYAYLDLCCGQTGGLFVHMVDVAQWYLGITKPMSVVAGGGIYQYDDGRDTPDNINVVLQYPEKVSVTFEASLTDPVPREREDVVFIGSGGRLHIFRYGYRFLPAGSTKPEDESRSEGTPHEHMRTFLESVRFRKPTNATVEQGHYGAMACHMANLAYASGTQVTWRQEWDIPS
jgi:predicted dehydrogenase